MHQRDRKSTRLNSSHGYISYAVFCLKKKRPEEFGERPGTIFSYVMNNYWDTNYRASQGGYFKFRYVVTSAPSTDMKYLSRRGWEEMTPLETDIVTSQDKALAQTSSPVCVAHTPEAHSLTLFPYATLFR